jgi:hypothetical protein
MSVNLLDPSELPSSQQIFLRFIFVVALFRMLALLLHISKHLGHNLHLIPVNTGILEPKSLCQVDLFFERIAGRPKSKFQQRNGATDFVFSATVMSITRLACLRCTCLQNHMVYINTLMLQQIEERSPQWAT